MEANRERSLRFIRATALIAAGLVATSLGLTACSSDDSADAAIVTTNAGEPQNPLVPTNTNENMGGRVVDRLFAGLKYYDATVTAKSFVDAWNYGALGTNAQLQGYAFSQIAGFDEVNAEQPKAQTMSGLKVVDDRTFTVELKSPSIDFESALGYAPFYPLPEVAFKDMKAFGEKPVG
ncbi:ABC transporter substrate-binding protein, partial [Streptomyces californicus]